MELSEMKMQYQGFHPSEYTQNYLDTMMGHLYSESPNGSYLQAVFSRQNHIFKVRVRIDSSRGHFFAVASGRQVKEVTHRIVAQIRKQIGKWKTSRFSRKDLSVIPITRSPESEAESNFQLSEEANLRTAASL
jgi:hypothetical protein